MKSFSNLNACEGYLFEGSQYYAISHTVTMVWRSTNVFARSPQQQWSGEVPMPDVQSNDVAEELSISCSAWPSSSCSLKLFYNECHGSNWLNWELIRKKNIR